MNGCTAQSGKSPSFQALKKNLVHIKTRSAYDSLHFLLTDQYTLLSAGERKTLRETLERFAVWHYETMCRELEPGTKIRLTGRVTDAHGKPVPGAKVHIFQTNFKGYYTPTDSALGRMDEPDARLNGFLTADSSGIFTIYTVRPGSYPKPYNGRLIPQHIHLVVTAAGFQPYAVQAVFEDDPAFTAYWKEWAQESRYPVIKLDYSGTRATGEVLLTLEKS